MYNPQLCGNRKIEAFINPHLCCLLFGVSNKKKTVTKPRAWQQAPTPPDPTSPHKFLKKTYVSNVGVFCRLTSCPVEAVLNFFTAECFKEFILAVGEYKCNSYFLPFPGRNCRISRTAATGSRRQITWPRVTWRRWTEASTSRTSSCKWRLNSGERSTAATDLPNRYRRNIYSPLTC